MRTSIPLKSVVGALALSVFASGCSSIIDPHLDFGDRPGRTRDDSSKETTAVNQASLNEAILYAERAKDKYRDAVGDTAKFDRLLGVALIGVATATPIGALSGVGSNTLAIIGVSGAGTYSTGVWLQSDPTERAYVQGYLAVNCAVEAMLPLHFASDDTAYSSYSTALADMPVQIGQVMSAMAALRGDLSVDATLRSELLANAATAVAEARAARATGLKAQNTIKQSGERLANGVDRIIGEVDAVIQDNRADLSSLQGIISGIAGVYSEFPGAPPVSVFGGQPSQEAGGPETKSLTNTRDSVGNLADAVAVLVASTVRVSDFVGALGESRPTEALKACNIDPASVVTAMSIEPSSSTFTSGRNETRVYVVQGGAFPYTVSLVGGDEEQVVVAQLDRFGPAFSVTVTDKAAPGAYAVHAADQTGRRASLPIKVEAAAKFDDAKAEAAFNKLAQADKVKVQKALCVNPDDGIWGPITSKAFQEKAGATAAADPDAALRKLVEAGPGADC